MSDTVADRLHIERLPPDRVLEPLTALLRLDGRRILVTGATSGEFATACESNLRRAGAEAVVLDGPGDGVDAGCDIGAAIERLQGIDVLVHATPGGNGTAPQHGGPFVDMAAEDVRSTVAAGFRAALGAVRAAAPQLVARGGGRIVMVVGDSGGARQALFDAGESAVRGFARAFSHEMGPAGVSVVTLCREPGWSDDDTAATATFLASEMTGYVHGTAIGGSGRVAARSSRGREQSMSLGGQTVVIAGGSGPSLGRATAHRLASLGANLVLLGRDQTRAAAVAREIESRWGTRVATAAVDVTDAGACSIVLNEIAGRYDGIDVIVHNAGGAVINGKNRSGPFLSISPEDEHVTIELNLLAVCNVIGPALAIMRAKGRGRVVVVGSEAGKMGAPNFAAYAGCKTAVHTLVERIAAEVGAHGVTIAGVSPGTMLTDGVIERLRGIPADSDTVAHLKTFPRVTLGRCSRPDEVANIVAYLASPAAVHIHGTVISSSGGMSD